MVKLRSYFNLHYYVIEKLHNDNINKSSDSINENLNINPFNDGYYNLHIMSEIR